jgi:hyperosmotically inducible periplasmic protein
MIDYPRSVHAMFATALLALSCSVYAQTSPGSADTATASAASGASALSSGKASKAADRKLAHRVATALARTRGLNAARIFVKARDGHITLSGAVTDSEQISLATDAARQVDGVKIVETLVRVSGPSL